MEGIQYIINEKGEKTHLVADLNKYGDIIEKILEEIADEYAYDEGIKTDKWFSYEEIRNMGIDKGIAKNKLQK